MNELIVLFFFSICCCELLFFKIIATAHVDPQTAIILSVLTLKLQVSDNILQNQVVKLRLEGEDSGAGTVRH